MDHLPGGAGWGLTGQRCIKQQFSPERNAPNLLTSGRRRAHAALSKCETRKQTLCLLPVSDPLVGGHLPASHGGWCQSLGSPQLTGSRR